MKKLVVLLGALGLSVAAFAGDMEKKEKAFNELDQNKDGLLTQQEASKDSKISEDFARADSNQDGYLTAAEYHEAKSDKETEDAE